MPPLQIREAAAGGDWVLQPSGDLDMASAPDLDAHISAAARDHPDGLLIIDLARVRFMDSSGLRVLLRAAQGRDGDNQRLRLRSPGRAVRRVVEVSGAEALLPFE
jgi:anti-sigma B factor antagonist